MLIAIPPSPHGRLGAVLSALIVCCCVIGLTMHRDFYAGRKRKDFFCFYTNVSNLLVLAYFAVIAPRLYASKALRRLIPHAEFFVMMSIMLTFMVFNLLLFPSILPQMKSAARNREFYIVLTDNAFVHDIVPLLVFLYWLICAPGKQTLGLFDATGWTFFPLLWLFFIYMRALRGDVIEEVGSPYPYPFLDAGMYGRLRVFLICTALYASCVLSGIITIRLLKLG